MKAPGLTSKKCRKVSGGSRVSSPCLGEARQYARPGPNVVQRRAPGGAYIGFYVCASLSRTWKKGRIHTERCLPATLPLPQNPACFAKITSAVSRHVRVNLQIVVAVGTTIADRPPHRSVRAH